MPEANDEGGTAPGPAAKTPRLPPRWFVRAAWAFHRGYYRVTGGRRGLWVPKPGKWGALKLTTIGRTSGQERVAILGYFEHGDDLVTRAMNGWGKGEPAWWLNLQAHPDAEVELKDGVRRVRARAAEGDERTRLWAKMGEVVGYDQDAYAKLRPTETTVVVLQRRED
jgi:deazaflavin-dependent oxidoreductase (nitroreductase family)